MLNLVITYSGETSEIGSDGNDFTQEFCDDVLGVCSIDKLSRADRIKLFEKINELDKIVNKDVKDYFGFVQKTYYSSKYDRGILGSKIAMRFLTDDEMIMLDAKRAVEGKKPIDLVDGAAIKLNDKSAFDNGAKFVERAVYDAIGKKVYERVYAALQSPKDLPPKFTVWATTHREFEKAPKEAPKKAETYKTPGEEFVDSFETKRG